ncbi:MAG: Ig-like domain-containing protein [Clostridia bacterium]|nr:Ig-like domain-containing protein [Clostridia bacterium]
MKRFFSVLITLTILISAFPIVSAQATLISLYAERDYIELEFSGQPEEVSVTAIACSGNFPVQNVTLTVDENKAYASFANKLAFNETYELIINNGDEQNIKYFMLKSYFTEDFESYTDSDEIYEEWMSCAGGADAGNNGLLLLEEENGNKRMKMINSSVAIPKKIYNVLPTTLNNDLKNLKQYVFEGEIETGVSGTQFHPGLSVGSLYGNGVSVPLVSVNNGINTYSIRTNGVEDKNYTIIGDKDKIVSDSSEFSFKTRVDNKTGEVFITAGEDTESIEFEASAVLEPKIAFKNRMANTSVYIDNIAIYTFKELNEDEVDYIFYKDIINRIELLPDKADVSLLDGDAIIELYNQFEELDSEIKQRITNSQKLIEAKEELDTLENKRAAHGFKACDENDFSAGEDKIFEISDIEEITSIYVNEEEVVKEDYVFYPEYGKLAVKGLYFLKEGKYLVTVNGIQCTVTAEDMSFVPTVPVIISEQLVVEDNVINVSYGITYSELKNLIKCPFDCGYSFEKSDESRAATGDKVTVFKLIDSTVSKVYTINADNYIQVSKPYSIDLENEIISDIPYAENKNEFLNRITRADIITLKIYRNAEETVDSVIVDGDILKVFEGENILASYTLGVNPPSDENWLKYNGELVNAIDNAVYGTSWGEFGKKIEIPEFAVLGSPFSKEELIKNNFVLTVTAQSGNERKYNVSVIIPEEMKREALTSGIYEIDSSKMTIDKVEYGTSISEFTSALKTENNGYFEVYSKEMKNITSGTISGGETVRVYPEYASADNKYYAYTVITDTPSEIYKPVYVNAGDEGCIAEPFTELGWKMEGTGELGYYTYAAGNEIFFKSGIYETDTTVKAGFYGAKRHSDTAKVNFYIYSEQSSGEKTLLKTFTGLEFPKKDELSYLALGQYSVRKGERLVIKSDSTTNFFKRAEFSDPGTLKVNGVTVTGENGVEKSFEELSAINDLTEGIYEIKINFSKDIDADSIGQSTVRIISENGYDVGYSGAYNKDDFSYTLKTETPLLENVSYFLYIGNEIKTTDGYRLLLNYQYPLRPKYTKNYVIAHAVYYNSEGKIVQRLENNAVSVSLAADIAEEVSEKLYYIAVLRENGITKQIIREEIDFGAGNELKFNRTATEESSIKVFAVDSDNKFLGEVALYE